MKISCIIPAKNKHDIQLQNLLYSIHQQDFPKKQIEIIVVTAGDSEEAKAIGIRKSTGEICAMFCCDNQLVNVNIFKEAEAAFSAYSNITGIYSKQYAHILNDNSLNRYFSLMGFNDPVPFYLGKCDRKPHWDVDLDEAYTVMIFKDKVPSLGDNGFFFRRSHLLKADLDHYYPMDVAEDLRRKGHNLYMRAANPYIWHKTSDTLLSFLKKRYVYARDLYCDRGDRRWNMVGTKEDKLRTALFVAASLTVVQPLYLSIKGFIKIQDFAWFWHPIICIAFTLTYGVLQLRTWLRQLVSSSPRQERERLRSA